MGIALNTINEGDVGWFTKLDGDWTTLESQYVAQENADGNVVTVTSTTSETVLISSTTIPANALAVGTVISTFAGGSVFIANMTTPSVTFTLRWGGLTGTVLATFTWNFSSGAATTFPWWWDFKIGGFSTGVSGGAVIGGWIGLGSNSFTSWDTGFVTLDTTTSKNLVWTVTPSLASVSTTQRSMTVDLG
ncbi:MAG TPA: hypothetical protein VFF73_25580 [Planctomycetota bacterium]|nr:hypothetical protein [Planctomycetota bacterium]